MGTNPAAFQRNQIEIPKVECGTVLFNRLVVFITVCQELETLSLSTFPLPHHPEYNGVLLVSIMLNSHPIFSPDPCGHLQK